MRSDLNVLENVIATDFKILNFPPWIIIYYPVIIYEVCNIFQGDLHINSS